MPAETNGSLIEDLEEQIRSYPESSDHLTAAQREMWLAYGDQLLERGDQRGMAISLYDRLVHNKYGIEHLSHDERIALWQRYGELSRPAEEELPYRAAIHARKWHCGFVRSATFLGPDAWRAFEGLCMHPCGHLLSRVAFKSTDEHVVQSLSTSSLAHRLLALDLSRLGIGDAGVVTLSGASSLSRLDTLSLANDGITDLGAVTIAKSSVFENLLWLDLKGNRIDNQGATAIADSKTLAKLVEINLSDNRIGDRGARALHRSPTLARTRLLLGDNRITKMALSSRLLP